MVMRMRMLEAVNKFTQSCWNSFTNFVDLKLSPYRTKSLPIMKIATIVLSWSKSPHEARSDIAFVEEPY